MIYLLGGPPRVGKSIISRTFAQKHGLNVVSTDSLGAALENVLDLDDEPGLFIINQFNERSERDRIDFITENTREFMNFIIEESKIIWKAVKPFVLREQDEGRDIVVEGAGILPELVVQLEDADYQAVFIGNQGEEHQVNIKKSASENENDWMKYAGDEYIKAFSKFVVKMSGYIENESRKYGFEYIEMAEKPFHESADRILTALLMKNHGRLFNNSY